MSDPVVSPASLTCSKHLTDKTEWPIRLPADETCLEYAKFDPRRIQELSFVRDLNEYGCLSGFGVGKTRGIPLKHLIFAAERSQISYFAGPTSQAALDGSILACYERLNRAVILPLHYGTRHNMTLKFKSQLENLDGIYAALFAASEVIYGELKKGAGLKLRRRAMSLAMTRSSWM